MNLSMSLFIVMCDRAWLIPSTLRTPEAQRYNILEDRAATASIVETSSVLLKTSEVRFDSIPPFPLRICFRAGFFGSPPSLQFAEPQPDVCTPKPVILSYYISATVR